MSIESARKHTTDFMKNLGTELGVKFSYDREPAVGKFRADRGDVTGYRVSRNTLTAYSGLDVHPDELSEVPLGPHGRDDLGVFFFPDRSRSYVATSFCWKPLRSGRTATDMYQHRVNRSNGVTESRGISFEDDSAIFFKPAGARVWANHDETLEDSSANTDAFYDSDGRLLRVNGGVDPDGEEDMIYLRLSEDDDALVVEDVRREDGKSMNGYADEVGLDYPERVDESDGRYPFWVEVGDKEFQKPVQVSMDPALQLVHMSDWVSLGPENR